MSVINHNMFLGMKFSFFCHSMNVCMIKLNHFLYYVLNIIPHSGYLQIGKINNTILLDFIVRGILNSDICKKSFVIALVIQCAHVDVEDPP